MFLIYLCFEHNDVKETFVHKKSPGATDKTSLKDRRAERYQNMKVAAIVETFNTEYFSKLNRILIEALSVPLRTCVRIMSWCVLPFNQ